MVIQYPRHPQQRRPLPLLDGSSAPSSPWAMQRPFSGQIAPVLAGQVGCTSLLVTAENTARLGVTLGCFVPYRQISQGRCCLVMTRAHHAARAMTSMIPYQISEPGRQAIPSSVLTRAKLNFNIIGRNCTKRKPSLLTRSSDGRHV